MYRKNRFFALLLSLSLVFSLLTPFSISYAVSDYVTVNKTVNPDSIFVDEEAEITLSVQGSSPVNVIVPNDVILIIDKSGSMSPNYQPNQGEDKIGNAKEAAKGFIDLMDMSKHRVGVVDFSDPALIGSFALTTDAESAKAYIDGINANGGTATGDAIYTAMQLLEAKREEAQPVIVLLTDGEATIPKDTAYNYAKQAASAAKGNEIVFYTIALLSEGTDPDTSAPNLLLKEMATTAQHHHFVLGSVGLAEIYDRIVEEIGKASAYNVTLTDIVAPEFEIVPDSYLNNIPQPTVEGNKLIWEFQELKDEELVFKYKIRHKDGQPVGELPVASGSNITYLDYTDTRINADITAPSITVKNYPPDITSLSSDSCNINGGEIITIFGQHFQPGLTVKFGDTQAVVQEFVDSTQVKVTVPPGQQGTTTIMLANEDGQSDTAEFKYLAQPVVNTIEPANGLISGGTRVQITGQYFMQNIQVKFGEQQATNVTVSSDGLSISATTPAVSAPSVIDVQLINPDGTNVTVENGFTYELPPAPEITSITPNEGEVAGNETVFIEGANLAPDGEVYFGEKKASGYYRYNDTKIRVQTPTADTAGAVDVKVVNPDGQYAISAGGFTYTEPPVSPAPEIALISPNEGEITGNETVFIEGANFAPNGEVYFGENKVTDYYYYNDIKLRVTTPAAATAGAVDVKVVNPDGQYVISAGGFTYTETQPPNEPAPEIMLISPNEGEMAGNETVLIEGANFAPDGEVYFGENKATDYYYYSDIKIRVTTPAAVTAGAVDVKVVNPDGQYAISAGGFTYTEPPTPLAPEITTITPNEGQIAGNETVFIEGANFESGCEVYFGENKATDYYRYSDVKIRVTTPAAATAGAVDVKAVNPDGQSAILAGGFTYTEAPTSPAPEITSISPNEGEITGNQTVYIEGANFAADGEVYFGENKAKGYYRYSNTRIRVQTPAAATAGAVDVKVVNPDGQSATSVGGFTYTEPPVSPAPEITSISPNEGEIAGNETVFIEGTNLGSGCEVYFGENKVSYTYHYSDAKIRVQTPAATTAGVVDVKVVNPDGQSAISVGGFTYTEPPAPPAPEITLITPNEGEITGNQTVFIEGTNLESGCEVYFGENKVSYTYYYNDTKIRVQTPTSATAGAVDVKVVNPDGQSAISVGGFTYTEPPAPPAPEITSITPNEGKVTGNETVFIEGANFEPNCEVYFGESKASGYYRYSDTKIRVQTPVAATAGAVDVKIVNPDGQSYTFTDGFTYNLVVPIITSITPNEGEMAGNEPVFIEGTDLGPGCEVYFGEKKVIYTYRYSDTRIRVQTPAADTAGAVDVKIVNSDGQSYTFTDGFTYIEPPAPPAPEITLITPNEGNVAGKESVFIEGANLGPDCEVYFGEKKVVYCYRYNDTKIRVITPAADTAGTVDVKIVNSDGQSVTLTDGFTYTD